MLASVPASMLNQNRPDLGIPNRFNLKTSRFSVLPSEGKAHTFESCAPILMGISAILALSKDHKCHFSVTNNLAS
jgi:hypothetical protein